MKFQVIIKSNKLETQPNATKYKVKSMQIKILIQTIHPSNQTNPYQPANQPRPIQKTTTLFWFAIHACFQQPTILSDILVATHMMFSCGDNGYWFMGGVGEVILALLDDNGSGGSVEVLVCGRPSQSNSQCCDLSMGTDFTGDAQGSISASITQFWSPYLKNLSPPVRLDSRGGRAVCDAGKGSEEGFKDMKGNFTCGLFEVWKELTSQMLECVSG